MNQAPAPLHPIRQLCGAMVWVLVGAVLLHRLLDDGFLYVVWSDRDMARAGQLLQGVPVVSGAELSYGAGGRIPGGAQYALMVLPMLVWPSPLAVHHWMVLLDLAAVGLLGAWSWRRFGGWGASLVVGTYVLSDASVDTMRKLWNPGFMPLFSMAAMLAALRVVETRDARWLSAGLLAIGIGTQMHLAVALVGLPLLGLALLGRPRGAVPALGLGALLVVAAFAPYLAVEASAGWPNTGLLLAGNQLKDADLLWRPWPDDLGNLYGIVELLLDRRSLSVLVGRHGWDTLPPLIGPLVSGTVPLLAVGLAAVRWRGPEDRDLRVIVGAFALVCLYFTMSRQIDVHEATLRYFLPLMPLVGVLVAVGAMRSEDAIRRRVGVAAGLVPLLITASLCVRASAAWSAVGWDAFGFQAWSERLALLDEAVQRSGGTVQGAAARTVVLRPKDDGWRWEPEDGVAWELGRDGAQPPTASVGPCLAIVPLGASLLPDDDAVVAALQATFGPWLPPVRLIASTPWRQDGLIITYEAAPARCRTSLSNRYVLTPPEVPMLAVSAQVQGDGVHPWPSPRDGVRSVLVSLDMPPPPNQPMLGTILMRVDLDTASLPGGLGVEVHSNQLRGHAYNDRFYLDAMVAEPSLVLTSGERTVRLPLAHDVAGRWGVLTPWRAATRVPDGTWRVDLEVDVLAEPFAAPWPPPALDRRPIRLTLVDALAIGSVAP